LPGQWYTVHGTVLAITVSSIHVGVTIVLMSVESARSGLVSSGSNEVFQ
jgi:hypothetical protein